MNAEFFDALDALEKTKGIPKEYMLERVEAALCSAYKRERGGDNVRVALNPEKKDIKVYSRQTVVEEVTNPLTEISLDDARKISKRYSVGDIVETEVKTKNFGRLSAQTAKQVIIQGIREAERTNIMKEYEKKREEVVPAVVTKLLEDTGDIVVDTGTSETVMRHEEMIPGEHFEVGDRIKVFITEVRREGQVGPIVTLSRTHPGMIKRLMELEIPEIQDGVVIIKGVAREAGSRTKVSVFSRDEAVDPVGACIGERGQRIAQIVDELGGEKRNDAFTRNLAKHEKRREDRVAFILPDASGETFDHGLHSSLMQSKSTQTSRFFAARSSRRTSVSISLSCMPAVIVCSMVRMCCQISF